MKISNNATGTSPAQTPGKNKKNKHISTNTPKEGKESTPNTKRPFGDAHTPRQNDKKTPKEKNNTPFSKTPKGLNGNTPMGLNDNTPMSNKGNRGPTGTPFNKTPKSSKKDISQSTDTVNVKSDSPKSNKKNKANFQTKHKQNKNSLVKQRNTDRDSSSSGKLNSIALVINLQRTNKESISNSNAAPIAVLNAVQGQYQQTSFFRIEYDSISQAEADVKNVNNLKLEGYTAKCTINTKSIDPVKRILYVGRMGKSSLAEVKKAFHTKYAWAVRNSKGLVGLKFDSAEEAVKADSIEYKTHHGIKKLEPYKVNVRDEVTAEPAAKKGKLNSGKVLEKKQDKEVTLKNEKTKESTKKRKVEETKEDSEEEEGESDEAEEEESDEAEEEDSEEEEESEEEEVTKGKQKKVDMNKVKAKEEDKDEEEDDDDEDDEEDDDDEDDDDEESSD